MQRVWHTRPELSAPLTPLAYKPPKPPQQQLVSANYLIKDPDGTLHSATYIAEEGFSCDCKAWKYRKVDFKCNHILYVASIINGS